jgi:hypothetical protein
MKSGKLSLLASSSLLAVLAGQGCFYGGGGGYRYPSYYTAPPPAPTYHAPPPPAAIGAYDEQHVWRDRNWWVSNRRGWVQQYHPEWLHRPG